MSTRTFQITRIALVTACVTLGAATAQEPAAPTAPATLTNKSLPQMLSNLGYEPKDLRDGSWYLTVERGGFTFPIRCSLSGDGSRLWFSVKLGAADPEQLPPRIFRGLLARDTGTARFYFCDCADCEKQPEKELFLSQPTENRAVTPAQIRRELESFCSTAIRLEPTWKLVVNR